MSIKRFLKEWTEWGTNDVHCRGDNEMFSIIKRLLRRKVKRMERNNDEPLYGDERCRTCGGEIVETKNGANRIFVCWDCGRRV